MTDINEEDVQEQSILPILREYALAIEANNAYERLSNKPVYGRNRCKGNTLGAVPGGKGQLYSNGLSVVLHAGDYLQSKNCKYHALFERLPNPPNVYPDLLSYKYRLVIKSNIAPDQEIGAVIWPPNEVSKSYVPVLQMRQSSTDYELNGALVIGGGGTATWWASSGLGGGAPAPNWVSEPTRRESRATLGNDGIIRVFSTLNGTESEIWNSTQPPSYASSP